MVLPADQDVRRAFGAVVPGAVGAAPPCHSRGSRAPPAPCLQLLPAQGRAAARGPPPAFPPEPQSKTGGGTCAEHLHSQMEIIHSLRGDCCLPPGTVRGRRPLRLQQGFELLAGKAQPQPGHRGIISRLPKPVW